MKVEVLSQARDDLVAGFHFYEKQAPGLGSYFLDSLFSDIDSLILYGGIHRIVFGFHRALSKRFPFAVYYRVAGEVVRVYAVLDCRRNPSWIRKKLSES
jgi:plasmid stabilization system protein ParE